MSDQEAWDAATAPLSDELPRPEPVKEEKPAKAEPKAETKPEPEKEAVAPDHDDGTEEDGAEEGERKSKPGKWMRKALKSEAEIELLRKELEAVRAKPVEPQKPAEPPKPAPDEPKVEDFSTYNEYIKAITKYELAQEAKVKAAAENEAKAKQSHDEWVKAAEAKYKDFAEVALDPDLKMDGPTVIAIKESEYGADIAYFLGQNPDEAERIASLSPLGQAKAIGKIEARFEKDAEEKPVEPPPPKKTTAAPKPPARVSGRGPAEVAPEKMGNAEYRAWRASGGGKA